MGQLKTLGRRIELVSMDGQCHDITIGLYETRAEDGSAAFVPHSYSRLPGAEGRIAFIVRAMQALGGMEAVAGRPSHVRFACGQPHRAASRRLFLECCKLPSTDPLRARPASALDKKSETTVEVVARGGGVFEVTAQASGEEVERRLAAIAQGFVKLAELEPVSDRASRVRFPCARSHDPLMALLLVRALNVRQAMREQELMAERGVLLAPSAQKA
jgi:hypothetical protein